MTRTMMFCVAFATVAGASAQSYDFESLSLGDIVGQDGWVTVADPTPEAGAATIQSTIVSPVGGSTKALLFQRVLGQAAGASRRVLRPLASTINSGNYRVGWDLRMTGRSVTTSNLFLSALLYSGVGAGAINQIIQPYGQNGGGPGGALNGFSDIDGLDISGYVGYNLVSGYIYPDTWYRFEMDMDFGTHTITGFRLTDISSGTVGLPTAMGTFLPLFGHPKLGWYFNNDGTNWTDQWNRIAFRASGMQGDPGTESLAIDNFRVTPVSKIHGVVALGSFTGNVAAQRVEVEIRDAGGNILDRQAVAPDSSGNVYFYTNQTGTKTIAMKGSHWLRRTISGVNLATGEAGTYSMTNGDINLDNETSIGDYAVLSSAYLAYGGDVGLTPPDGNWQFEADLDGDNEVTINDYSILSANYNGFGDD